MKKIAALAATLLCGAALAQAPCPAAEDVSPRQLLGVWKAHVEGDAADVTLTLQPHPEYAESFSGTLERGGQRLMVAGDLDDDGFTLEESSDGKHIAATWLGDVVQGGCGREIRGTWTPDGQTTGRAFVLRKQ